MVEDEPLNEKRMRIIERMRRNPMYQLPERMAKEMRRFTRDIECKFCGHEIFATRVRRGNVHYFVNADDKRPHTCTDFTKAPKVEEVQMWGYRKGKPRKIYPSQVRRPFRF
ncbi:hypothetical protein GCM10010149_88300 [Nonomuraea roseoviolacea subsp. roseoviolacea]